MYTYHKTTLNDLILHKSTFSICQVRRGMITIDQFLAISVSNNEWNTDYIFILKINLHIKTNILAVVVTCDKSSRIC